MSAGPQLGDYGLVRTKGIFGWLIRVGTRSTVDHAVVCTSTSGRIVEAEPKGARPGNVSEYTNIIWSTIPLTDKQRADIAAAAESLIGTPYSWLDILALGFACYGIHSGWINHRIERIDRLVCSALVDRAYMLAGVHLWDDGRLTCEVTPQDLLGLIDTTDHTKGT